jgi:hypothetical protein
VGGWARDTLGSFAGVFFLCALAAAVMLVATVFMKTPTVLKSPPRVRVSATPHP